MVRQVELKWGVETSVQLSLCNPTPHDMTLALLPFVPEAYTMTLPRGNSWFLIERLLIILGGGCDAHFYFDLFS